jgi:hypothetical protein
MAPTYATAGSVSFASFARTIDWSGLVVPDYRIRICDVVDSPFQDASWTGDANGAVVLIASTFLPASSFWGPAIVSITGATRETARRIHEKECLLRSSGGGGGGLPETVAEEE